MTSISGPTVSQACATSATALYTAAAGLECGAHECNLVATTDRCSNGPHSVWPNPKGPGAEVISENWMMDNFNKDPYGGEAMFMTAELVGKDNGGVTKEESDALALRRYEQYQMALADDRAFQKGYMIPVDIKLSKKKTVTVEADEGIMPTTAEGLAGAQAHPARRRAHLRGPDPPGRRQRRAHRHHPGKGPGAKRRQERDHPDPLLRLRPGGQGPHGRRGDPLGPDGAEKRRAGGQGPGRGEDPQPLHHQRHRHGPPDEHPRRDIQQLRFIA